MQPEVYGRVNGMTAVSIELSGDCKTLKPVEQQLSFSIVLLPGHQSAGDSGRKAQGCTSLACLPNVSATANIVVTSLLKALGLSL